MKVDGRPFPLRVGLSLFADLFDPSSSGSSTKYFLSTSAGSSGDSLGSEAAFSK